MTTNPPPFTLYTQIMCVYYFYTILLYVHYVCGIYIYVYKQKYMNCVHMYISYVYITYPPLSLCLSLYLSLPLLGGKTRVPGSSDRSVFSFVFRIVRTRFEGRTGDTTKRHNIHGP